MAFLAKEMPQLIINAKKDGVTDPAGEKALSLSPGLLMIQKWQSHMASPDSQQAQRRHRRGCNCRLSNNKNPNHMQPFID